MSSSGWVSALIVTVVGGLVVNFLWDVRESYKEQGSANKESIENIEKNNTVNIENKSEKNAEEFKETMLMRIYNVLTPIVAFTIGFMVAGLCAEDPNLPPFFAILFGVAIGYMVYIFLDGGKSLYLYIVYGVTPERSAKLLMMIGYQA